jgi:hypothetical protein
MKNLAKATKRELVAYIAGLEARIHELQQPAPAAFWLVWRDGYNSTPHYKHDEMASAKREAERLAGASPGERFYVLPAYDYAIADVLPVAWKNIGPIVEEIPF